MTNLKVILIVSVVSLFVGYNLYPIVNGDSLNSSYQKTSRSDSAPLSSLDAELSNSTINTKQDNTSSTNETSELSKLKTLNEDFDDEHQSSNEVVSKQKAREIEPTYHEGSLSQELKDWSNTHKKRINTLIDEYASEQTSPFLKDMIEKNNDFLNSPMAKQDADTDINWAFIMEQDIRNVIMQHENSNGFDLLNLTCKQLTCEILGVEREFNSWTDIYVSMLTSLESVKFPEKGKVLNTKSFEEDGFHIIYAKLDFIGT
ncbi:hypothetical protein [Thalassotalea sp. ND16A]|uniref:hypothetical protein n=1 Tax=Thalassotalea sp. ND16A TaxID=1535422 RepID=UPI00051A14FD|nr:hypothetical protein [Thalassotalea sp. ND16A]KGJ95725.1 hypothetical protein ND16A_1260 [Thalassotalea sp. ND16A]